jgi:hypothetical protein
MASEGEDPAATRSNRNPLDNIPGHAPPPASVNLRGPRVRVPGEVLNVFEGHVLIEKIGHDRDPETVRGEEVRQTRIQEPPLQHLPHGVRPVSHRRQLLALAVGRAEEGRFAVLAGDAGGVQVFPQLGIQIATDGNLAHLAVFLGSAHETDKIVR